jgi:hypothetical protein
VALAQLCGDAFGQHACQQIDAAACAKAHQNAAGLRNGGDLGGLGQRA